MNRRIRVVIADDHKILREGLRAMIVEDGTMEVVGEAKTGAEAVELARTHEPDVITMDIRLPDMTGVAATKEILSKHPNIKVIALSMHADRHYVVEIMRVGAKGFLLKDCAFSELLAAVDSVMAGRRYLSQEVSGGVVEGMISGDEPGSPSVLARLSDREISVLKMMTEGTGASAKEIGGVLEVASSTIATHQQRLRKKLGVHTVVELTKLAIREGLIPLDSNVCAPSGLKT